MNAAFYLRTEMEHDFSAWTCDGGVALGEGNFTPRLIKPTKRQLFEPGYIPGVVRATGLLKHAEKLQIKTGILHAEAMLRDQQKIPKTWRNYFLVFPGEIWTTGENWITHCKTRYLVCLTFDKSGPDPQRWKWCLYLCPNFEGGFYPNVRLVDIFKKAA
jgi:hypothetical protein